MTLRALIESELGALEGLDALLFDVHSHTGVDVDGTTRSCEEQVEALARFGGRSAIFPLCTIDGYAAENRRVVEEAAQHADVLVPFARLDPRVSGRIDAEAALVAGARGFKLHPRAEDFRLEHPGVEEIVAVGAEARAPVLVHAGVGVGSLGTAIVDLAERHRECSLILAHAAVSDLVWLGPVAAEHPNLFFDTSWWSATDLLALFALVPPGQILFGSDEPYMGLELVLAIALRCARFAGLSEDALRLIFGGQTATLLAGEPAVDGGPAPGTVGPPPSSLQSRLSTLLAASGGAMLSGGDPERMLELARVAIGENRSADHDTAKANIAALVEQAQSGSADAPWAIAMAMTIALTPEAKSAAFSI